MLAAAAGGCDAPAGDGATGRIQPAYNKETGRLERITYDRNGDGKLDAWLYMDGTRVVLAELDETYDGKVDRWEYYGDQPANASDRDNRGLPLPRSLIVRAEQSTRDDGRVTRWETYEKGQLAGVQEDTTGNGRIDKWERYENGALRELQLDTKGTGHPDRRIVYPEDGGAGRLEVDRHGDGQFTPVTPQQ